MYPSAEARPLPMQATKIDLFCSFEINVAYSFCQKYDYGCLKSSDYTVEFF